MKTSFTLVYDSFLSKITDDMYLEMTQLDTCRLLQELLLSAIEKFQFPRVDLTDYTIFGVEDQSLYNGIESNYEDTLAIVYNNGQFNNLLTHEYLIDYDYEIIEISGNVSPAQTLYIIRLTIYDIIVIMNMLLATEVLQYAVKKLVV